MDIKPLKRFGQNYLTDPNILNKIVAEISPQEDENLIEIGPGKGALTVKLTEKIQSFTAIEIDKRVYEDLSEKFPGLNLVQDDFLDINLQELYSIKNKKLRVVGNIPYNITSPILFKMIENNNLVEDSVLMVQYEVAKRITGKKGTKDYGILSVLLNFFTDVKLCFKVSPHSFYPKPNVDSAVVHLFFKNIDLTGEMKSLFIKVVKASFGNRRKTLKNSLSNSIFKNIDFKNSGTDLTKRAEQLDIKHFLNLAEFIKKQS
ncbi:MAG: ribosomal RNA small subunit methyltransferase A [Ignavibacteriales bacterium]|nr:MAG: ribosomal RNA small subunit methyltransferase A [Ignavibacteriales bacterium]